MTNKPPPRGEPAGLDAYRPAEERRHPLNQRPHAPDYRGQSHARPDIPPQGRPQHPGYQPHLGPAPYAAGAERADFDRSGYGPDYGHPAPPQAGRHQSRHQTGPPLRARSGLGSVALYSVLGLIAMAAGAAAFAVMALPVSFVRDHVVAAVKEKTGRDLVIAGPASFSLYPKLGISLADVSLSGAPGLNGAAPLVTMKALDLSVALLPLLQRDVEVSSLVLREPVFNLDVDANGHRSWDFAAAADAAVPADAAERVPLFQKAGSVGGTPATAEAPTRRRSLLAVSDVRLDDVRIDNGTLNWRDQRTGSSSTFSAINVNLKLASMLEPLTAVGQLDWKGKTVRLDGALTAPADVVENRPAKLKLVLGADVIDATFEGSANLTSDLTSEGILSATSPSARALALWFGAELPPSAGFGALSAKGLLRGAPNQLSFSTAEIVLDRTTARGDITLDTRGPRPNVNANLKLTELDLNLYRSDAAAGAAPPPAAASDAKTANSIDDLLREAGPAHPAARVKGYSKAAGWSDEPLQAAALGALDANARLVIDKLTVSTLRLDQSDLTVALKNRVLATTLNDVRLYQGSGKGTVTIDGTGGTSVAVAANVMLDGIEGLDLLRDVAEFDRLTGKGRLSLAVAGQGATERQIVGTLNGKVDIAFRDGAIIGINVAEMMRGVSKGDLGGLATKPTDKTDFSEMTSTWTLASGIAQNSDLKLASPLIRLTGSGQVGLPQREVDYVLRPKLVASLAGQGSGAETLSGLEIPVRMHGTWQDPKFTPDLSGAIKDPNAAIDTIKEIGGKLKGKKADEIVNGLIGGTKEERKAKKEQGKKLIEQLLRPQ